MQKLRTMMLPLAMLTGAFFYDFFQHLAFLTPYLIFLMLMVTYCKVSFRELKLKRLHLDLLGFQIVGCLIVYGLLVWWDPIVAEGCLICVLAPTATAAAVITGMLGGGVALLATYTLLSSLVVALVSPLLFAFIGEHAEFTFGHSLWYIGKQVIPLLILPCVLAFLFSRFMPKLHSTIIKWQVFSFYLWVLGLTIVTGKTVYFMLHQDNTNLFKEWCMALFSLVICILQFAIGRSFGKRYGDAVAGGQGLGQKNTILAIWMAQMYLHPLSSIAPASYVLWQNMLNSWQLWKKNSGNSNSTYSHG